MGTKITASEVTSLAEVWIETMKQKRRYDNYDVTSLAEVWIETRLQHVRFPSDQVTSLAEVWIETFTAVV